MQMIHVIDKNVSKTNKILNVLRVQDARISLKINVQKTHSFRLGIN